MAVFFGFFGGLLIIGGLALVIAGLLGGIDGALSAVLFGLFLVAAGVGALLLIPKLKRMGQQAKLGLGKTASGLPPHVGVAEVLVVGKPQAVTTKYGQAVAFYVHYDVRVTLPGLSPYDAKVVERFATREKGQVPVGTRLRVHVDPVDSTLIALARTGTSGDLVPEQPGSLRSLFEPES